LRKVITIAATTASKKSDVKMKVAATPPLFFQNPFADDAPRGVVAVVSLGSGASIEVEGRTSIGIEKVVAGPAIAFATGVVTAGLVVVVDAVVDVDVAEDVEDVLRVDVVEVVELTIEEVLLPDGFGVGVEVCDPDAEVPDLVGEVLLEADPDPSAGAAAAASGAFCCPRPGGVVGEGEGACLTT
jgi:hypothetical protein